MTPKRVLLLGAETARGVETARALAAAGHTLALISATADAEAAFAVQRLARKLGAAASQAIDATNEAAVRVMVRQVSKALGGIDQAVSCVPDSGANAFLRRFTEREVQKSSSGQFIDVSSSPAALQELF